MSVSPDLQGKAGEEIVLEIEGMTCATCANRIEKRLNKVDGVSANVNYATEKALVFANDLSAQELVQVVEAAGYAAREAQPDRATTSDADALRPRMILAFILAVPVVMVSMVPVLQFPAWQWVFFVLTAVIVFWAGRSFHQAALLNLRHRSTTMDTLVSMGTLAAFGWSTVALLFGSAGEIGLKHEFSFDLSNVDPMANVYFEAAAAIIAFLLLGRWIEARSKREAGAAVRALMEVAAKEAVVLRDGNEVDIAAGELAVGDLMVVRPGAKVPADGEVETGTSAVDASIITGESLPVEVAPGSHLVGGSLNTTGRLVVRATAVGSRTQLSQIAKLVEEAQAGKSNAQRIADRVTSWFVPVVIAIAAVTFLAHWVFGSGLTFALTAGIAVLIIACPCALGLATPSALLVGTGRGAQLGTIIRGAQSLEKANRIDTVVLDKTGTLTTGEMAVLDVDVAEGSEAGELLAVAAAIEGGSEHPIARAIVAYADSNAEPQRASASNFNAIAGKGIEASVSLDGGPAQIARAGSEALVPGAPVSPSDVIGSQVLVQLDDRFLGRLIVGDELKPNAASVVTKLKDLGLRPVLLTGDNTAAAEKMGRAAGIDDVRAEVLPQDKAQAVRDLQFEGRNVAMVGDGVNDAAALASANLGIAMGRGTDAAIAASDIMLMRDDLLSIVDAVRLSRATDRTIRSNLVWAFLYNVLAIPVAALGFLTPMIAGAAMAFSSVFVVLNSLRLRGFRATAS